MISPKKVDLVLTILFVLFTVYILSVFWSFHFMSHSVSTDHGGSDIFELPDTFDVPPPVPGPEQKMTWDQFKQVEHINEEIQMERDIQDKARGEGEGTSSLFLQTNIVTECDTCTGFGFGPEGKKTTRYYVGLQGYSLSNDTVFHFRYGRNYLHYPSWDSIRHNKYGDQVRYGHYMVKEVPFRFVYDDFEKRGWENKGTVLIPVSKGAYRWLYWLSNAGLCVGIMLIIFIFFALPAKILLRIAQGQAFTRKNIRQLHLVAWTILGCIVFLALLRIILRVIFRKYLTSDLHFDYLQIIKDNSTGILIAIVFFIIAKAFKKGYKLQNDQDLTI